MREKEGERERVEVGIGKGGDRMKKMRKENIKIVHEKLSK